MDIRKAVENWIWCSNERQAKSLDCLKNDGSNTPGFKSDFNPKDVAEGYAWQFY
jgi:hypothetical protein